MSQLSQNFPTISKCTNSRSQNVPIFGCGKLRKMLKIAGNFNNTLRKMAKLKKSKVAMPQLYCGLVDDSSKRATFLQPIYKKHMMNYII